MRITNKMMTTNMLSNINKNKQHMSLVGDQYATGQKIQRPSEDPIIAVRSLKYRTNLAELTQFYQKNLPDARSWMDVTEGAFDKINDLLESSSSYCNQGTNDPLSVTERDAIVDVLKQYKEQIYQYANSDYAGRYVFTGYRTDVPLLFDKETTEYSYKITEPLEPSDLSTDTYVKGGSSYIDSTTTADQYAASAATQDTVYRMKLAYAGVDQVTFSYKEAGNTNATTLTPTGVSVNDANVYDQPVAGTVKYIKETGELIFNKADYEKIQKGSEITATYTKDTFNKNEIRPEHYFDCEVTDVATSAVKTYTKPVDQEINYEISFGQKIKVNSLANQSVTHDIGRQIDEMLEQVKKVEAVEAKLADVKNRLKDESLPSAQKDALEKLQEVLETEHSMQESVMRDKFGTGITKCKEAQNLVSAATADLGSRMVRLNLTEERLSDQYVDFTETLKKNDGVDLEDAVINFESAKVIYNASLSAAAKIVQNSLLNFL